MRPFLPATFTRASRRGALLSGSVLLAASAAGQRYACEVVPSLSSASLGAGFEVGLPGTLIGAFDPVTNPTGTRTLPGLFGGSGNEPVDVDLSLDGVTQLAGAPTGAFGLDVDLALGLVTVEGLELDLLGGVPGSADLTLELLFDTFRTFDPTSLYIGGFPLPLPLGSASVSQLVFVQTGPGAGTLAPTAMPGTFDLAAVVTGELAFVVDFAGTATPVGPVPFALPLSGQVTSVAAGLEVRLDARAMLAQTIRDPLPGVAVDDIPLDLPTILPPGAVANLLLSFAFGDLEFQAALDFDVTAAGALDCGIESYCSGALNSTGSGATLTATGSTSLAAGDLVLAVDGLPAGQFGYFLLGTQREDLPGFGGGAGQTCIAAPIVPLRTSVQRTGTSGSIQFALGAGPIPSGPAFEPGDVWNFQFWYRDPAGSAATNTSSALSVVFCP